MHNELINTISTLTGIKPEVAVSAGFKKLFETPSIIDGLTKSQLKKVKALKDFFNIYSETLLVQEQIKLDSSHVAQEYISNIYKNITDKEHFSVVFMDTQNNVIYFEKMFTGTIDESPVYVREIIKRALEVNAKKVMLAHNHPAGSLRPSNADLTVTGRIRTALKAVDMEVVDHIIVTPSGQTMSFQERGCM